MGVAKPARNARMRAQPPLPPHARPARCLLSRLLQPPPHPHPPTHPGTLRSSAAARWRCALSRGATSAWSATVRWTTSCGTPGDCSRARRAPDRGAVGPPGAPAGAEQQHVKEECGGWGAGAGVVGGGRGRARALPACLPACLPAFPPSSPPAHQTTACPPTCLCLLLRHQGSTRPPDHAPARQQRLPGRHASLLHGRTAPKLPASPPPNSLLLQATARQPGRIIVTG